MIHRQKRKKPQQSRASLILTIVLAFLLIVGAAVLISQLPDDESWQLPQNTDNGTEEQISGFDCEPADAQRLYPFGERVVRVSGERITCLDILGSERFAVDVDFENPFVTSRQGWLLTADRESRRYVMITPDGEAFRGQLQGLICDTAISPDGTVALIQEQEGSTGVVTILEAQTGRHLFDCFFPESGYVLSVAFTKDNKAFDVVIVNTDGSQVQMIVKRFDLSGKAQGQLLPDINELSPLIVHQNEEQIVLAGYSQLMAVRYETDRAVWTKRFGQITSITEQNSNLYVLASEKSEGAASLYRITEDGTTKEIMTAGENKLALAVFDELIALGNGSHIRLLQQDDDDWYQDVTLQSDIIRFAFSDDESLIAVTHSGVRRINIVRP